MANDKPVKVTMKTRDDMQAPTTNMPVILGVSETDLRGAAGSMSNTTYLGFQFQPHRNGLPTLNADCEVLVKEGHDIELEDGVIRANDFLTNASYIDTVYQVEGNDTDILVRWKIVAGVVNAIIFVEHGSQLKAKAICNRVSGPALPCPAIPGSDNTAYITSSSFANNLKRSFTLNKQGVLKVGPVAMPTLACVTFNYIAEQE